MQLLEDKNAKVEFDKLEELKVGDNILKIDDTISTVISFGILGLIGYLIYNKKTKKK